MSGVILAVRRYAVKPLMSLLLVICLVVYVHLLYVTTPNEPLTQRTGPLTLAGVDLPDQLSSTSESNDSMSIIVHVICFFPPRTELRFHEALALMAVQLYARPRKILFWYDAASTPPVGRWWMLARYSGVHVLPVPYRRPKSVFNQTVRVIEHQSDVARLAIIERYGGLYIDLDVILVRPLNSLFRFDVVLGAETPELLGSGFILARRPGAEFIRRWRRSYADKFDDTNWNHHACRVPMMLAGLYPNLIHVEWYSIHQPNWFKRQWLYTDGLLWDWSRNFAVHLWFREHPKNVIYDPVSIRRLKTTTGQIFRYIYYGDTRLLPPVIPESTPITGFKQTTTRTWRR